MLCCMRQALICTHRVTSALGARNIVGATPIMVPVMQAIINTLPDGAVLSTCKHTTARACCTTNKWRRPRSVRRSNSLPDNTIETIAPTGYDIAMEDAVDLGNTSSKFVSV